MPIVIIIIIVIIILRQKDPFKAEIHVAKQTRVLLTLFMNSTVICNTTVDWLQSSVTKCFFFL